jgi:nucleoside phosphorylase
MIPGRRCILFYYFFSFNLVIATVFYRAVFSLALVSKIILTQALVYFRDGVPASAVLLDAPLFHVEIKSEKFADPNVYIGVFGSGSAVMANDTIFAEIGSHSRKIIGIDMEAYALFVAAERTISNNKPKALVIKGVQDYADSVKSGKTPEQKEEAKRYTKYGSFASAMFFINACDEFLISDINQ